MDVDDTLRAGVSCVELQMRKRDHVLDQRYRVFFFTKTNLIFLYLLLIIYFTIDFTTALKVGWGIIHSSSELLLMLDAICVNR